VWRFVEIATCVSSSLICTCEAYSGCMDILLALLPWKMIWKLQMRKKEKFGIALAMSMGIL
jgi:hypothetical protein